MARRQSAHAHRKVLLRERLECLTRRFSFSSAAMRERKEAGLNRSNGRQDEAKGLERSEAVERFERHCDNYLNALNRA